MTKLQQQLAGVREQADEPDELKQIEDEIERTKAEIESLKNS